MIKHIVGWNFKEEFSGEENLNHAKKVKEGLEGLQDKIEGIKAIEVIIERVQNSIFDVVLLSEFDSLEALETYQVHEEHVKVSEFVGTVLTNRTCVDYEV